MHGPRQRGRAVGLHGVDVCVRAQQGGERFVVAAFDGFEQPDVALLRVEGIQRRPGREATDPGEEQD